jgi:hypothetical protein
MLNTQWYRTARARIEATAAGKPAGRMETLSKELDMSPAELVSFQEHKTLAVAEGTIDLELGQRLYRLAGNSPGVFNRRPLADKVLITELHRILLQGSLARRDRARAARNGS